MDWLELLVLPALFGLGGLIGWAVKSRLEELQKAQERLASERRKLYADLLDPYVKIFAGAKGQIAPEDVQKQILSIDYRRTALEVVLIGTDEVVDAYNDLMQHFYKQQAEASGSSFETLRLYGVLLLAIRKSLGNSTTRLTEWDMLRHMITDIDEVLRQHGIERKRPVERRRRASPNEPPSSKP
jgi:hypothetical protein